MIRTVLGDIAPTGGPVLTHEHLQIDLSAQKGPNNVLGLVQEDEIVADLRAAKALGLTAITDLSAPGWGRDVVALARISRRAELPVVAATGFYWDPFPQDMVSATVETMRDHMVRELEVGVGDGGPRCGLIKVGTDKGEPSAEVERLFLAAGAASRATGFPIITHTSNVSQAAWHLHMLGRSGVDMSRVLISHMGAAPDVQPLVEVGRHGVFMGIDKVSFPKGPKNPELADLVCAAIGKGLVRQLILSSDVARLTMLSSHGAPSYSAVLRDFVPMLRERGVTTRDIDTMLIENPARLLSRTA